MKVSNHFMGEHVDVHTARNNIDETLQMNEMLDDKIHPMTETNKNIHMQINNNQYSQESPIKVQQSSNQNPHVSYH